MNNISILIFVLVWGIKEVDDLKTFAHSKLKFWNSKKRLRLKISAPGVSFFRVPEL